MAALIRLDPVFENGVQTAFPKGADPGPILQMEQRPQFRLLKGRHPASPVRRSRRLAVKQRPRPCSPVIHTVLHPFSSGSARRSDREGLTFQRLFFIGDGKAGDLPAVHPVRYKVAEDVGINGIVQMPVIIRIGPENPPLPGIRQPFGRPQPTRDPGSRCAGPGCEPIPNCSNTVGRRGRWLSTSTSAKAETPSVKTVPLPSSS